ncbi:hypothetical protein PGT21_004334 [Puccinia graminis f. sp. tritici]|uniref:VTT domain-containing protein n=2 Tax=Puccinia graminis f. sp. tritici TaxID=56615 RepID=E3JVP8_PUCGT|nr:uncharacterized protein PGTG_02564 [Puccinia graminis f. sp. tritici CRL 75-36-700-3]EFP76123.1 hypothetical protein PGTG_02564 [Puccinia graminis f. sp. tritici CRL 75-36-700-3]KAA1117347.1 hypothetical protein PGT21_004334 [Puccinia graminis f. sp. tritici]
MSSRNNLLKPISLLILTTISSLLIIKTAINSIPFLRLPTSIELISNQIHDLRTYSSTSTTNSLHLALVLSIIFVSKQAFSVPGTALLNILIGSIYPIWIATPLSCLLTALGSTGAYLIALTARPLIVLLIPRPLKLIQRAVDPFRINGTTNRYHTAELSSYLLIARLLPIVPYAALNLASGVLELPLIPFFWTILIGSLPYNLLTTQLGDILRTASESSASSGGLHPASLTEIWTLGLLLKLASLSVLAILPILFKESLRNAIQAVTQGRARADGHRISEEEGGGRRKRVDQSPTELLLSPILCPQHHELIDDELDQLSPSTSTSSSSSLSSSSSSSDELIIHLHSPNRSPTLTNHLKLSPSTHLPVGLAILNHNPHSLTHHHPAHASIFDLPYRKVAKLHDKPANFSPFS